MFRIVTTSRLTGNTCHGEPMFTEERALNMIQSLNKEYPDFNHTIEKYEPPALSLNVKGHRCSYGDLTFVAHPTPTASAEATPVASKTPVPSTSTSSLAKEESPQLR
jgi:hypothetical protein